MIRLDDRVAIVTGGARGIGEGIAKCLTTAGARVAILDLDGDQAARTAASLPTAAIGMRCDAAVGDDVVAATARVADHFGRIDFLVNNAGAGRGPMPTELPPEAMGGGITAVSEAAWDEGLAQNLRTTFLASKAAIPFIRRQGAGAIVNISSIAGLGASPTLAAYGAAKAGVINFTMSLALELAPEDIRVNAICPGFLYTRAWEGLATVMRNSNPAFATMTPRDVFLAMVKQGVPMGREQTPEDIGNLAAFLCSDLARNITGQFISVDGGITLR